MWFAKGSVFQLVKWFGDQRTFDVLCLYLAGGRGDKDLLRGLFEDRDALDVLTGNRIAVMLFVPGDDTALRLVRPNGQSYSLNSDFPAEMIHGGSGDSRDAHAFKFDPGNPNDIVSASQTIAHDIIDYFKLDATSLSSFIILVRGEETPLVLPTKEVGVITDFFSFIKEVRAIFDRRDRFDTISREVDIRKLDDHEAILLTNLAKLDKSLDKLNVMFATHGISIQLDRRAVTSPGVLTARQVVESWFETNPAGMKPDDISRGKLLCESEEFRKAFAAADKAKKNYCAKQSLVARQREKIEKLRLAAEQIEKAKTQFGELKAEIEAVTDKFASKLKWRARFQPLTRFVERVLGIAKASKDLLDVSEKIEKLIAPHDSKK